MQSNFILQEFYIKVGTKNSSDYSTVICRLQMLPEWMNEWMKEWRIAQLSATCIDTIDIKLVI